jgi:methionyl-tRNA formyltransferase
LPRHRGPDPYFAALFAGDEVTGVTAHRLEREYDTGAILGHATLPINPTWNAWKLAKALDRPSLQLLRRTAMAFAKGTPPKELPQDPALVTEANAPTDDDLALDLHASCNELLRLIRAAAPWPGAFVDLGHVSVVVSRAVVDPHAPRALAPGDATIHAGSLYLCAADGTLRVTSGRLEGAEDDDDVDGATLAAQVEAAPRA